MLDNLVTIQGGGLALQLLLGSSEMELLLERDATTSSLEVEGRKGPIVMCTCV